MPVQLTEAEFRETLGHSVDVLEEANPELEWLFGMVGKAGCCLVLTDSDGVVLDRRGVQSEDKEFRDLEDRDDFRSLLDSLGPPKPG